MIYMGYGTWVEPKIDTPSLSMMYEIKKKKLDYSFPTGYGLGNSVVEEHAKQSFFEPFLGKIYYRFRNAKDQKTAYMLMKDDMSPNEVTIEGCTPGYNNSAFIDKNNVAPGSVRLVYSSYNRLVFKVKTAKNGFFGFSYPYTGHWNAYRNNQKIRIFRANGAAHAIELPFGENLVEFRYWSSAAFWGMIVSCLVFGGLCISIVMTTINKPRSIYASIGVVIFTSFLFYFWYFSLYNGDNLNTIYKWKEKKYPNELNIAYGKKTAASSIRYLDDFYYRNSSRAVDGEIRLNSGFITNFEVKPWWVIDLNKIRSIIKIVIYENRHNIHINKRPLLVSYSNDFNNWNIGWKLTEKSDRNIILETKNPIDTRYILIQASGKCQLAIDEVEIISANETN